MKRKHFLLLGLAALVLAAPLAALPKTQGSELRVNSPSAPSLERHPVAAFDAAGNSLVVWEDEKGGLVGRFFNADGSARGAAQALVANRLPANLPYQTQVGIQKDATIAF